MFLLAQELTAEGVRFLRASCRHKTNGTITHVVVTVASEEDAETVRAWADRKEIDVQIVRATPEEIRQHEELVP